MTFITYITRTKKNSRVAPESKDIILDNSAFVLLQLAKNKFIMTKEIQKVLANVYRQKRIRISRRLGN